MVPGGYLCDEGDGEVSVRLPALLECVALHEIAGLNTEQRKVQRIAKGQRVFVFVPDGQELHGGWWEAVVSADGNTRCSVPGESLELVDACV